MRYLGVQGAGDVERRTRAIGRRTTGPHVLHGHVIVVRFPCKQGVGTEHADTWDATPLGYAGSNGLLEVVRYLCEQDANEEHASSSGRTPLRLASQLGHHELLR